jgi:hypothetical protein
VADAAKFESAERYNDGGHVMSVTLQAKDGIILLNDGSMETSFLPLIPKRWLPPESVE